MPLLCRERTRPNETRRVLARFHVPALESATHALRDLLDSRPATRSIAAVDVDDRDDLVRGVQLVKLAADDLGESGRGRVGQV